MYYKGVFGYILCIRYFQIECKGFKEGYQANLLPRQKLNKLEKFIMIDFFLLQAYLILLSFKYLACL